MSCNNNTPALPPASFYSTNLNNRICLYEDLAERIAYDLGWPQVSMDVHQNQVYDNIAKSVEMFSKFAGYTEETLIFHSDLYEEGKGLPVDQLFSYTPELREEYENKSCRTITTVITGYQYIPESTRVFAGEEKRIDSVRIDDSAADTNEYTFLVCDPVTKNTQVSKMLVTTSWHDCEGKVALTEYAVVHTTPNPLVTFDAKLIPDEECVFTDTINYTLTSSYFTDAPVCSASVPLSGTGGLPIGSTGGASIGTSSTVTTCPFTAYHTTIDAYSLDTCEYDSGEYIIKFTNKETKDTQVSKILLTTRYQDGSANIAFTEYGVIHTSDTEFVTLDVTLSGNMVTLSATGDVEYDTSVTKYETTYANDITLLSDNQFDIYASINSSSGLSTLSSVDISILRNNTTAEYLSSHKTCRVRGLRNTDNEIDTFDIDNCIPQVVEYNIRAVDKKTKNTQLTKILLTTHKNNSGDAVDYTVFGTESTLADGSDITTYTAFTTGGKFVLQGTPNDTVIYEVSKINPYDRITKLPVLTSETIVSETKMVSGGYDDLIGDYRRVVDVFNFHQGESTGINTLFTIEQTMAQQTYFSYALGKYGFDLVSWYALKEWLEVREKMLALNYYFKFDERKQRLYLTPDPRKKLGGAKFWGIVEAYVEKPIRDLIKEPFVYQYALALTKITTARVRSKFTGTQLFGGGQINYTELLSEGLEEKRYLEEKLYEGAPGFGDMHPPRFFVG